MDVVVWLAADVVADAELGTRVYRVPPGELVVGRNARVDVPHDPDFAASIRVRGVLQPITCYIADAALAVHMGQRRALVAAEQGLEWVPVVLTAPPDEEGLLIEQLVENEHRSPITTADRAAAVAQLSLLGLTAEQLVRRTALRRGDVDAALAAAASPTALAAAAAHPAMDLAQVAGIAEFEDEPDVVEELTEAAEAGHGFEHLLQRARDDRRDAAEKARVLAEIRASGVTALERLDWSGGARPLNSLGITPDKHRDCPGHAAYPSQDSHYVDGHREWTWAAAYVCTQPRLHRAGGTGDGTLDAEAARAERAEVVARNKEWRSATVVRRAWLREFAHRPRPPAGVERFVAAALLRGDDCIRRAVDDGHALLRELLAGADTARGRRDDEIGQLIERAEQHAPKRALVLAAAALLAAWEHTTDVDCWRPPLGGQRGVDRFYLAQLVAWGYPPSDVERLILDSGATT